MLQGGARPGYGFCLVIVLLVRPFCAIDGPLLSVILELRRRDRHSMPFLPFIVNAFPMHLLDQARHSLLQGF